MAYVVMANVVMTYTVMAYVGMTDIFMAAELALEVVGTHELDDELDASAIRRRRHRVLSPSANLFLATFRRMPTASAEG